MTASSCYLSLPNALKHNFYVLMREGQRVCTATCAFTHTQNGKKDWATLLNL